MLAFMKNPKILVPVDFSVLSESALMTANVFARRFKGTVTPFHAYIPVTDLDGFYYVGTGITPYDKYDEIENVLRIRLQEVATRYIDPANLTGPLLDVGNPAKAIAYNAGDFDMVVLSTHGRTGFNRFCMGSVTEKVLRMCPKPVITVTMDSNPGDLTSILLTTDFSENSIQAFPIANSIARATGGHIDLVHIVSNEQYFDVNAAERIALTREIEIQDLANQHFANIRDRVNARVFISNRSTHVEIAALAHEKIYDLIIMSSVGRSGLEYLMMGSTASNVVRTVKNAVLTINPQGLKKGEAKELYFQNRNF